MQIGNAEEDQEAYASSKIQIIGEWTLDEQTPVWNHSLGGSVGESPMTMMKKLGTIQQ